ncbi:MAG: PD-(D/E)XK nuclease family protein [Blautia sp.]|nr:PD-(D/E)XK nuclease family protein [Blautia sp.]
MALKLIIGSSGAGKSYYAYQNIIKKAAAHMETAYFVIVPEQFTMQTQKDIVELSPRKGILNIDVLSFNRLAYRISEEVGEEQRELLEDTGKVMVLQKIVQSTGNELAYLGSQLRKQGCMDEMKSLFSEFMQYSIEESELEEVLKDIPDTSLLHRKMQDISKLYREFLCYLRSHYLTSEEVMDRLVLQVQDSVKLKNSVVLLDGFTGFTPIQTRVVEELLKICQKVIVTVTMDPGEPLLVRAKPHQLFYMSHQMIQSLLKIEKNAEVHYIEETDKSRFSDAPALRFLEKNLFRYSRARYGEKPEEIQIFSAPEPKCEMEETARRIHRLVREKGFRYGEIAVITGNLEEYGNLAEQIFSGNAIPYFVDDKHSVMMNPFVEYIRASIEMCVQGFTYQTVFRYLRCTMSDVTRMETDRLENYVLALGIRGFARWDEKWVRIYRGMRPEEILQINESREKFIEEVRPLAQLLSGKKKTVRTCCEGLYQFITDSRIYEKLQVQEAIFRDAGNKAMEKEYGQIYAIVMNLLDKMVEILGEEMVSPQEFAQILETGLSRAQVALIPPAMDQVLVGDMERTRLKSIRALFFVGVNEGNIPKNVQSGGILTEMDRDFFAGKGIELAPGPKEAMGIQRFYLYLNLTKPRELLCLSYSQTNGSGESAVPAYLVANLTTMFPKLEIRHTNGRESLLEQTELPGASLKVFQQELRNAVKGNVSPFFLELYSWYLNSPEYEPVIRELVRAAFYRNPKDVISKSAAKALYGEISIHSATRLEKYAACAFAHFLQYGLRLTERAEYTFRAMDMGNLMHTALEDFALSVQKEGLTWAELTKEQRTEMIDASLDKAAADYGNTILSSNARNEYMLERTRRILHRTVWALQEQLKNGEFSPESFEVSFQGGRIDRVDLLEESDKVYVRVIDYKTGSTSFDLVQLYHGLQLQLMIYLNSALQVERAKHPEKEIIPAGIFYYNIKDPMLSDKIETDIRDLEEKLLKELKMNGLAYADRDVVEKMDRTCRSLPVDFKKDGTFTAYSSVADQEQFTLLEQFIQRKTSDARDAILEGNVSVSPYELGSKNACMYCPYETVCGFDCRIPGFEFRRLQAFEKENIWSAFQKETDQAMNGETQKEGEGVI